MWYFFRDFLVDKYPTSISKPEEEETAGELLYTTSDNTDKRAKMNEHKRNLFNFSTIEGAYENNIILIYNDKINPKATLNSSWNVQNGRHLDTLVKMVLLSLRS